MTDLKLVLMSCCAPCSCGAIKQLHDAVQNPSALCLMPSAFISDFIVLFYNPNIYPETEYQKRLAEQIKYCESMGVKYAIGDYDHAAWLDTCARGLESEPERGKRCTECFKYRFKFAKQFAEQNGYNAIASVLGISKHKDQSQVDAAAMEILGSVQCPPPLAGGDRECGRGVANYHSERFTRTALGHSKTLKRNMTDAERLLWYYLRNRKDFSFRKQAPIGNYIADFLCVAEKLIIELDGSQHGDEKHVQHDTIRDKFLNDSGYRVLRFWNDEVFKNMDMVLNTIYHYLTTESHPPSAFAKGYGATPPAKGGGHSDRAQTEIKYIPINWDLELKQEILKNNDFYRQNYCGCEFSIRK